TGSLRFPIGLLAIVIIVFSVASLTLDLSFAATGKTSSSSNADRLHRRLAGSATNLASAAPKIVFGSVRNGGNHDIFVMDVDGSNRTRLTNDSLVDGVPAWSPDGTKIVFMSGTTSVFDPNSFEIFVMNADGSNRTRLTNNTVADGQPSFSPDGTKILFASGDAMNPNGMEIFVMNAHGTGGTQLTSNSVTDGF